MITRSCVQWCTVVYSGVQWCVWPDWLYSPSYQQTLRSWLTLSSTPCQPEIPSSVQHGDWKFLPASRNEWSVTSEHEPQWLYRLVSHPPLSIHHTLLWAKMKKKKWYRALWTDGKMSPLNLSALLICLTFLLPAGQCQDGQFVAGSFILTQKALSEAPYRYSRFLTDALKKMELVDPPSKRDEENCNVRYRIEPSGTRSPQYYFLT